MTTFEKFKLAASIAGVIIGMFGCFFLSCGLLSENGPASLIGGLMFIVGMSSAFID